MTKTFEQEITKKQQSGQPCDPASCFLSEELSLENSVGLRAETSSERRNSSGEQLEGKKARRLEVWQKNQPSIHPKRASLWPKF